MTAISRWRPTVGLSIVVAPYWVPILVGLRWGIWAGGDPLELARSVSNEIVNDWAGIPLKTPFLAPFVLVSTVCAVIALTRYRATASPAARHIDLATLILAAPYLTVGAFYLALFALFWISCTLQPCSFLFM